MSYILYYITPYALDVLPITFFVTICLINFASSYPQNVILTTEIRA